MELLYPYIQIEVRFSHLINISQWAKDIIAPFVRLAGSYSVTKENTIEEQILLHFQDNYHILLNKYSLALRTEGNIKDLKKNGSIIEEPYLNILGKIKSQDFFGPITHVLYASTVVKPSEGKDVFKGVLSKSINAKFPLFNAIQDFHIDLDIVQKKEPAHFVYGYFKGVEDLEVRNQAPTSLNLKNKLNCTGEILQYSKLLPTNDVTFSLLKELMENNLEIINDTFK